MKPPSLARTAAGAAALLLGLGLVAGLGGGIIARVAADDGPPNYFALHDRASDRYDAGCTGCHQAVLTEQSLNPAIHTAHVVMQSLVPGESRNDRCAFCHRSVTWLRQGTGSLRKHVDARLCAVCHAPEGPGAQFYQVGVQGRLDGAGYYGLLCEGCHGPLARSEVRGESAREIRKKIDENEGGMGPLAVLTAAEIQAIASALATAGGSD